MDVNFLFKVFGIGVTVAVACRILIKSGRDEQAVLLSVAGIICAMLLIMDKASELIGTIKDVFGL